MTNEDRYDSLIVFYSKKWNREPKQVKKQIRMESNFNPKAKNKSSGAKGLTQFMDRTWTEWWDGTAGIQVPPDEIKYNPYDPEANINSSCAYMNSLQTSFGKLEYALAAYNWGPGNLRKLLKSLQADDDWKSHLPEETRGYVTRGVDYQSEALVC